MSDLRPPKPSAVPSVKATGGFLPVLGQRPAPPHRMTCADAMKLGAMCNLCPLSKGKLAPLIVPPSAVAEPKFIIVGEGPGRVEQATAKPFVGPTGQFLNRLLQEAGVDRAQGHITNVSLCMGDTDKEKERAAECCSPRLLRELAALPADIPILTLGKFALKTVLGTGKLFTQRGSARGFFWRSPVIDDATVRTAQRKFEKNTHPDLERRALTLAGRAAIVGRIVLPTLHPAFVLRAETWKPIIAADIKRFGRIVRGELTEAKLADNTRPYKVYATPENIRRALAKLGWAVAWDIETDGINPMTAGILCVGVSDGRRTIVIGPWDKKVHASLVTEAAADRRNIFHNGVCFDTPCLRKDGVILKNETLHDTLIAHHVIGSCFPQRLDHCVATYLDATPWKVKYGRQGQEEKGLLPVNLSPAERHLYNSKDAVLTIDLWVALQDDLAKYWAIYEHDMALAHIATQMIQDGIGVDLVHRDLLRKQMKKRQDALKGLMRVLVKNPNFQVTDNQIRQAIYKRFHQPVFNMTPKSGLPSTASATLEVFKGNGTKAGRLAELVLTWRAVRKSRTTYIDAMPLLPEATRLGPRVRTAWKVYGTPTGRWSSRLQSIPRPELTLDGKLLIESRVREIYVPRPKCVFVYFDISQAEARIGANISGDPAFLETCKGDVHLGNACAIWPQHAALIRADPKGRGKPFRDAAKNFMFGIVYGSGADTIQKMLLSKGHKHTLREVTVLLEQLRRTYRVYFRYIERNVAFCQKEGYLPTPYLGRRRYFGRHPKAEEIYNFPCQSGVADEMNLRMLEMMPQLPKGVRLVGQFHDAAAFETPVGVADEMEALIKRVWARPSVIPKSIICEAGATFMLPIDLKRAMRLSELA